MRRVLLTLGLALAAGTICYTETTQPRSIWDGVYTEEQAKRGEEFYPDGCSRCHGDELEGDESPALASEEFLRDWKGLTLADLFLRVKNAMPGDKPGTLKPNEIADVLAYVLSRNKVPAGKTSLPTNLNALKEIRIDK
jgi:mono/diheme cytochrome c family protein